MKVFENFLEKCSCVNLPVKPVDFLFLCHSCDEIHALIEERGGTRRKDTGFGGIVWTVGEIKIFPN